MKSLNHRICGIAFLMAIGCTIPELVYTFFASSVPDQIERIGTSRFLKHRGISHDLGLWGALLSIFLLADFIPYELISLKISSVQITFRSWVLVFPPFFHSLLDALTSRGVPFFVKARIRFPILEQNKWYEHYLSWGFLWISIMFYVPSTLKSFLSFIKNIFRL